MRQNDAIEPTGNIKQTEEFRTDGQRKDKNEVD